MSGQERHCNIKRLLRSLASVLRRSVESAQQLGHSLGRCKKDADHVETLPGFPVMVCRGILNYGTYSGIDRSQMLLLPERVEDYVEAENAVRFVDAFVDGLDLEAAGFWAGAIKGDGSTALRSCRPTDAVYLWLPKPDSFQPSAGGGVWP